jgi:chemotaxis protein MotA
MLMLVGLIVVTFSVFAGFMLEGGPMLLLVQPVELMIIGGAAGGVLLISTTPAVLKQLIRQTLGSLRPSPFSPELYLDTLQLMYELLVKAKKNGLIALEKDLSSPADSPVFAGHPKFLAHHEAVEFTCEALTMLVDGTMKPDDFDAVLDVHLEIHHEEEGKASILLQKVGDTLPGLGIVAAVLGIVITMGHLDGGAEEIGHHVAAALVGTFLGILLAYGIVGPLALLLEQRANESTKVLQCVKVTLLATLNGYAPAIAIEFGRKVLYSTERPGFAELEEHVKGSRA